MKVKICLNLASVAALYIRMVGVVSGNFPRQAKASPVGQDQTANDVRVGDPSKSGWDLQKVGVAYGKVGAAYKKKLAWFMKSGRGL